MNAQLSTNRLYSWLIIATCGFLAIFYFAPVLNVLLLSITDPTVGLGNYELLGSSAPLHRVLINTLSVSAKTTLITLALGYLTALGLYSLPRRPRNFIFFIIIASFWISALIRAYAWVAILRPNGVANSLLMSLHVISQPIQLVRNELGVTVGMVHYMLPYAILPIYSNISGIDRFLAYASRSLGAGRWRTFWLVFFPQTTPGLMGAGILVLIFSLGFYITPAILGGGRVVMVAQYIALQISETLRWGLAAMLATVLLLAVVALTAWMTRYLQLGSTIGSGVKS